MDLVGKLPHLMFMLEKLPKDYPNKSMMTRLKVN